MIPTASPVRERRNQPGTNQSVTTWNMDPVIELKEIRKSFGAFKILDGVTCRIPRGGVTALMGPSGTGKSVSLRHIVGLLMPDAGDCIVDGKSVPRLREKEILELRRALVMEPKILLVDEPDSGFNPVRTTLLCDLIKEIAIKYQATVVVVTHNVFAVRRMADYIGILYKGKMRHFGTREEIENSPDEFIHQFFNAEADGPLGMD